MIKKFFQDLNASRISYLLISGQATVIYGAVTFSEDIDLWIEPEVNNWNKFLKYLNEIDARIYKLTPPISMESIRKGHGFHFQVMSKNEKPPYWFLDVMGVVPRVGSFKQCFKNAVYYKTEWGRIPVVGIRNLVEIKKTRRLEDYPVISNLVRIEYDDLIHKRIKYNDWKWILMNTFNAEDILYYLNKHISARNVAKTIKRSCMPFFINLITYTKRGEAYMEYASREIALEIEHLRKLDRKYWEDIIDELKQLKQKKHLLISGVKPPKSVI